MSTRDCTTECGGSVENRLYRVRDAPLILHTGETPRTLHQGSLNLARVYMSRPAINDAEGTRKTLAEDLVPHLCLDSRN